MEITQEMISKLAKLSKLDFSNQEQEDIQKDLQNMLHFVNQLQQLDTSGVEPLLHITQHKNILREDEVISNFSRNEALQNANNKDNSFFKVPKVIQK